ncbi:MAG: hypothetical protein F6K28_22715 [Microcoleus sp. SIO2G3]|nr:hypothetical protein [Microcoleus sp. SIO2G3]
MSARGLLQKKNRNAPYKNERSPSERRFARSPVPLSADAALNKWKKSSHIHQLCPQLHLLSNALLIKQWGLLPSPLTEPLGVQHVGVRLQHVGVRLQHVGVRLQHVGVRLQHVGVRLPLVLTYSPI